MAKVLEGVRVIEQGTYITGPAAGMLLADLGADVIKVERPETGDPFRAFKNGLYSPHFQTYNRNKRSVTLDTRVSEDREVFDQLIASADIYIQNFRPETVEKLGLDEARLRSINPRLIYCSITGFGEDGPDADRPAYDTVAQAASGFLGLFINPANPRVVGPALADSITGFYAAYGILGALHERNSSDVGRRVDVSMLEAMCHFNLDAFTHYLSVGEVMGPYSRPRVSQSYVFECQDHHWIALHMSSPEKFWRGLVDAIEAPELLGDERFSSREGRIHYQEDLIGLLKNIFMARPLSQWCERLLAQDVPHSPMYAPDEALESPQAKHLQIKVGTQHPSLGEWNTVRSPVSFDGERPLQVTAPPTLGEHNQAVRAEVSRQCESDDV